VAELLGEEIEAVEVEEVSREQIIEEIDREARESLEMSFDEFLRAYREGDLPDTLVASELVSLLRFAGRG
jgi:FKBP-type peptidyl-prolyl cis-trans isomerase (trigger factor)